MSKVKKVLIRKIAELLKMKIEYYRSLGSDEINIQSILENEVFEDIYNYLDEGYGYILDTITPQDAIVEILGGVR